MYQKKRYTEKIKKRKFNTELCKDDMTFEDCEIAILRNAVDETDELKGKELVNNDQIREILKIVEKFIVDKKRMCYGGTAINNILPQDAQFYNRDIEIPDYDFFSPNALEDSKELADIYYKNGYKDVEAKAGVHMGTFKVFVNFIPIADITFLETQLYNSVFKDSIEIAGIHYAPPNYLRMAIYLELSRPFGDVSRWEKVMKRLNLLNKYYPLIVDDCNNVDFQRQISDRNSDDSEKIYIIVRNAFIEEGAVFFGGYATSLYSKYMPIEQQKLVRKIPDFDVLSEDIEKCTAFVKEKLKENNITGVKLVNHDAIGELVPEYIQIKIGNDTIAFVYKPIACHSYNEITINENKVKIATIDTILAFYLSFIYADFYSYYKDRLLCMAKFLFDVELKNRLEQRGLLKRFSIKCYGKQETLEEIRSKKADKYKELANKKDTKEYEMWFLKYNPGYNYNPDKQLKFTKKNKTYTKTKKNRKKQPTKESDFLV